MNLTSIILLLIIGILAGTISGLLGIGGGIIVVPALIYVFGMIQHQAQGTSLGLLSIPVALSGAINYYKSGNIDIKMVLILAVAFIAGAYGSSLLAVKLSGNVLKKIFAIFLIITAIKILFEK